MKIQLIEKNKIKEFYNIFDTLKNFNDIICLQFEQDKLYCQSMDQSNVSLFELSFNKDWFNSFIIGENCVISIRLKDFVKLLSIYDKYKILTLSFTPNEDDCLKLTYENIKEEIKPIEEQPSLAVKKKIRIKKNKNIEQEIDNITKNVEKINLNVQKITESIDFSLPTIDYEYELLGIPDNNYPMKFSINSDKFVDILKQLSMFDSDVFHIIGSYNDELLKFRSVSDSCKETNIVITNEMLEEFELSDDIDLQLSFKYIKMCINDKLTKIIQIGIENENPIYINYPFEFDLIKLRFFIAPKFDDN